MEVADLLLESYGRIPPLVHDVVEGLDAADLAARPRIDANPIGWLTWHLTRVQDHHLAELLDQQQVWMTSDWPGRFGLVPRDDDTGYGHATTEVARVRPDGPGAVTGYHDAVWARTRAFLSSVRADDLDEIVDDRWDPPVTLGVRLVSVVDDCAQHVGQAALVRGLLEL